METTDYNSKLFKNIFTDYDSFVDWWKGTLLYDDDVGIPSKRTYGLIAYEYSDSHSAFSVESFKDHFAIDLYTYYKEFEETTKVIDELMKLTDDDISTSDSMITNFANIPETASSTDVEEVDFVSTQQKSINKKGKLQIKKEQLTNKRAFTVKTFLKRFKHLFIRVISPSYTAVVAEPEGE